MLRVYTDSIRGSVRIPGVNFCRLGAGLHWRLLMRRLSKLIDNQQLSSPMWDFDVLKITLC